MSNKIFTHLDLFDYYKNFTHYSFGDYILNVSYLSDLILLDIVNKKLNIIYHLKSKIGGTVKDNDIEFTFLPKCPFCEKSITNLFFTGEVIKVLNYKCNCGFKTDEYKILLSSLRPLALREKDSLVNYNFTSKIRCDEIRCIFLEKFKSK